MDEHGGALRRAARRYGVPLAQWLDLSTGINPRGWPVPPPPATVWARLPEEEDGLERAAAAYYGCETLLPVPGTQAAIQALPALRTPARVGVLTPGYVEHARAWTAAGHRVMPLAATAIDEAIDQLDVLLLCHPNNPDGRRFPRERLLDWHERLARRGGWLVLDEAFVDPDPGLSLAPACPREGLVVLRSPGKFFGLAGIRLGFVLAVPELLAALAARLGPWAVSGPARWAGAGALADLAWQRRARRRLVDDRVRLVTLLSDAGLAPAGGTDLFQLVPHAEAAGIHDRLARQGVLTRSFPALGAVRFGLPGSEEQWRRLEQALAAAVSG